MNRRTVYQNGFVSGVLPASVEILCSPSKVPISLQTLFLFILTSNALICVFFLTRWRGVKQWLDYCLIPSCIHDLPVNVEERVGYNHSQEEYQTFVAKVVSSSVDLAFFLMPARYGYFDFDIIRVYIACNNLHT
jgi:hypothetical protein